MPSWRVLYVQSRYEFKVEQQLERLGIIHYLPKLQIRCQWSDRIKKLLVPAFPSYLFVHNDEKDRNEVFRARGVMHYLRQDNKDATLRTEEMELLQKSGTMIQPSSLHPVGLLKGDRVLIKYGLLAGQKGILVDWAGKKAVQLKLENISMGFLVELPLEYLEMA